MPDKITYRDVSGSDFKEGMRHLAASVTVITVAHNGKKDGLTATATCAVSAEPPQLLVCVNKEAGAHDLIQEEGVFGVNVLARDQEDIAKRFAGIDGADRIDRYSLGVWTKIATGAPILEGALASFDCQVAESMTVGTHSIFIGRIVGIKFRAGPPLIYGDAQFTGLSIPL